MSLDNTLSRERRRVTVLFADISDSTRFVEKLDPEEAASALTPTVEAMAQVVQQFDGTTVKLMGDGIMAIFGAPVALERHAERACRAALEMQQVVEARRMADGTASSADLRIHVGLATGEVVAGLLGEHPNAGYDAAGFTIHLASRLQRLAPSGCIYISRGTYQSVREQFACESLGPTQIRGSTEPMEIYRLGPIQHNGRLHHGGEQARGRPGLVGRSEELAVLSTLTRRLVAGHGGVVSIVGDAGLGKSRLVAEFRAEVGGLPVAWLEGAALSYGRTLSYWPFREILRAFAGIEEDDDETQAWRKLEDRIADLFGPEDRDVLPYIATLLGLRVTGVLEERVKYLDGEAIRRQVFRSMRLLFERLAQHQPIIVMLEDAFWMDLSSATLLAHLMPLIETTPLLFCMVTRGESGGADFPVRMAAARDHPQRYTEIALRPLSPDDTSRLIDQLVASPNLPRSIRKTILATTEGNPLYVEEVTRALLESGAMIRDRNSGEWQAAGPGSVHFEVPGTIQSVIMARVDQLEERAKDTLKTAAVIGRLFFVRVLASMLGSELTTQGNLAVLRRADLILDRRIEPEPECMFKHVLVQEATYDSILVKRRRELHALAGTALEHIFRGRLDELYGLLAYHYARAEMWEKAQDYLLKAGDQADRLAANEEALSHFQSASEIYLRAFGRQATPLWQATIARKIGEAHYRKGDHAEAQEKFREALGLLEAADPRSGWGLGLQILRQAAIQLWHRMLPIGVFDRRLGNASPAEEERIRIYIMQWWLHFFESPLRTLLYSLKTLNESERCGALVGIVHSCSTLGFICGVLGLRRLGLRYHLRADARSRDSENPVVVGHAALGLGWHGSYGGQWPEALAHFGRSAAASRGAGDLRQWGSATWGLSLVLCHQGRFAAAWEHAHELREISEASGDQVNFRWSRLAEAMILLRIGSFAAADAGLKATMEDGRSTADWQIYTRSLCELARSSLYQGDPDRGARFIREAAATAKSYGLRGHHVSELHNIAAALLLARIERTPGRKASWRLRWQARRACRRAIGGGRIFRGALPQALRLRGRYAWLVGDQAAAASWWQRSLTLSEELGANYDLAQSHLEIGNRLQNAAHLAQAHAIMAETRRGLPAFLLA